MAWQESLLSLSGLKKDYSSGGQVTGENLRFYLFTLTVGKKRGCGGRRSVLKIYFYFLIIFVLILLIKFSLHL